MTRFVHIAIGREFYNVLKEYFENDTDNMFIGDVRCLDLDITLEKLKSIESSYNKELDVSSGTKIVIWYDETKEDTLAVKFLVSRFKINDIFKVKINEAISGNNKLRYLDKSLNDISIITNIEKNQLINQWEILKFK